MQWEDHHALLRIFTPKPFSFKENVAYLARSADECMFEITDDKIYRALPLNHTNVLIEISAEQDQTLVARFLEGTEPQHKEDRAEVARYIWDWFDLETDLQPFYALAEKDPLLREPAAKFYGLRNVGLPDLFEALAWGILGQQINLTYAYTLKRRFVETFGEKKGSYWLFPKPEKVASLQVEELAALKMTQKKAEYLIDVANRISKGKLSKEQLLAAESFKDAESMLTGIRGIGPWTANYVLMRCLRYPSAFPIDDVGLQNAFKLMLGYDEKPTKEEIRQYAENWKGWETYATFYLWRMLY
ncbi:DNA-3-methyladenine glycosylase 2 family protein [Salicibibacter halophilus]|uniref:DNA-3-methyladenine glycosylase II n=1 Tax=Salicibibacter halophilus TaxID=2502791 RepID=A0A514LJJ0_9BACI|nr:DNA-3-methyladenine glycosylase [Salicibibacter halophilus]QDI91461.1 DNA-3-methyladenine glycosylase 2 family protein [Salicibibacter halophilus]